jgi:catalase
MADPLAEQAVGAINEVSGRHEGHRAAHAGGVLCAGQFTAEPGAEGLTKAPHMQGETVRATVRFSNGSGNPKSPDYVHDGRGMAVKLYLPDGAKTDMVSLTLPVFFVRTPEDFVEFTRAQKRDPETGQPDMERIGAYLGEHPEAIPAAQAFAGLQPPASYANCVFHGIHSFRWIPPGGEPRFVRYRWEPEDGVKSISPEEAKERGPTYLKDEILERDSAAFTLMVQLAEEGDPTDDPTAAWPEERETVPVGRLEVTGPETEREQGDDVLVFDPTRVVEGIECSADPILNFRPRAYAVSIERRSGAPIPAGLA